MKKATLVLTVFVLVLSSGWLLLKPQDTKAFTNGRIIDDSVFDNTGSMSTADIQNFLNRFPNSCIKSYAAPDPNGQPGQSSAWTSYGGNVSAAQVIKDASSLWGINPQVILTTLQKEEQLIDGSQGCATHRYWSAMGYDCPSSDLHTYPETGGGQTCVAHESNVGFSAQVNHGAWQLEFGRFRSEGSGNLNWDGDNNVTYYGYMTAGCRPRVQGGAASCYDGNITLSDGNTVFVENGATASLYSYTPYLQSFGTIFTNYFGSTYGYCTGSNVSGVGSGEKVIPQKFGGTDTLSMVILNQTATGCIESHTWASVAGQQWLIHAASNRPSVSPADSDVISGDGNGDRTDEMYEIDYQHTGSGMIEFHVWSSSMLQWVAHVASNRPAINPADAKVIIADLDGDGRDESYLVQLQNTASGMIEVHGWTPNLQQWSLHAATNRPAINPADATVIAANHQLCLVQYRNTASGRIEVHCWAPGTNFQQWASHTASNYSAVDPADNEVVAADSSGSGNDNFYLIQYRNTASGRIEVHRWTPDLQNWTLHSATNQPSL